MLASLGFAAFLLASAPAFAQVAPNLGTAAPYAVLGTSAISTIGTVTCTDTGPGIGINGQVGTTFAGGITNTGCAITGPKAGKVIVEAAPNSRQIPGGRAEAPLLFDR